MSTASLGGNLLLERDANPSLPSKEEVDLRDDREEEVRSALIFYLFDSK